jgi:Tol biopolymer transport system component/serine/threonine protein kinase/tetratricopeptide (TPR) repeat protein
MTSERWKQVEEIFQSALDLPRDERERFIAESCATDQALCEQVNALIRQYEASGDFIENPAFAQHNLNSASISLTTTQPLEDDLMTGRRIGAYRIVREIGRGGMGAVYLAVRADSEFQKRVAIKLIKRGMDTDFVLRRFRNERQILASLDHPNIARLLDGGTTEDGLPYFVMDYIEGQPIYQYCDRHRLTSAERLRLFCQACAAISYAHQHLIVHRDIKPGNILITSDRVLKLLDFGIAKLLNPEFGTNPIAQTVTAMQMMTPEYASPEQVQGLPATPASDIYSLGVLLYELLTGHRPYHFRFRAMHEIARVICEEDPIRPSEIVVRREDLLPSDNGEAITLEYLCRNRGGTPETLRREFVGDLDNIVLKALRKEPHKRYESVNQLCEDITRYLKGHPVTAQPYAPTHTKSARLKTGEATGDKSIAVLPFKMLPGSALNEDGENYLGLGLADALITRLSNVQRISVRPTSSVMRFSHRDYDLFEVGRELGVRYLLDGRIQRVGERIRVTVQLVGIQDQTPIWAGQFDEEFTDILAIQDSISEQVAGALLPQLTAAERARLINRGTDNPQAYEAYLRGRYHWNRFNVEDFARAITYYYEAIALDPDYAAPYTGIADYYNWLGVYGVMPSAECFAAAKEAAAKAVELDPHLAEAHAALSFATLALDWDRKTAEDLIKRAIELNPNYATAHQWNCLHLASEGRFEEAVREAGRALQLDPLSPGIYQSLGMALYQARRFPDSIKQLHRSLELDPNFVLSRWVLGWALVETREFEESIAELKRATLLTDNSPPILAALGVAQAAANHKSEARRILAKLERAATKRYVSPYHLALIYTKLGETEQAFASLERAIAMRDAWMIWLGVEPQFDPLRSDSRFSQLLGRVRPASPDEPDILAQAQSATGEAQVYVPPPNTFSKFVRRARHAWQDRSPLTLLALIAVALGITLLAFFYFKLKTRTASSAITSPVRLTFNLARDVQPDWSPDGQRIVFASDRDGALDLYLMNADGSDVRRLTHNTAEDFAPAWSPDGGKIAFTSKRDGNDEIYVMDADGSNQTNISRNPASDSRPAWSPDGKRIVFMSNRDSDQPDNFDIYLMSTDGSNIVRLTDDPKFDGDPAWSPDGGKIAFASDRSGNFEIYLMNTDGSEQRNITNNPAFDSKPVWSPDGSRIAFISNRSGNFNVYVMNADGTNVRNIINTTETDDEPGWAPDGKHITYQTQRDGNFEIYVADASKPIDSPRDAKQIRSLAVLPFTTVGASGDAQYLGVGIADLLTNKLGQINHVMVRTSGAVRKYLGAQKSPSQIGRELGVDYVLAGTVQRIDDRVQATLQLIDTSSEKVMWVERFDEPFTDIYTLQNQISERILHTLSLELTTDERARLAKRYTENSAAQQLYLAGRYHWGKRTPEGLRQAISNFEQAIAKDPNFALAYTGLADCYALLNWYLEPPPADAFARAEAAARKAVELDDSLAEAHASLAFIKFHYDRDWRGAEGQFRRAINLNPNYPTAHHWYAFNLSAMGRHEEAIAEAKRAQEIDPRSAVIATAVANVLYHAHRFDEAIEQCQKALELDPGSVSAHVVLRWAYERKGMSDAAFAVYEKERAFAGDTPTTRAKLAHVLAAGGQKAEARKILDELLANRKSQWVTPYEIAVIYALLDNSDNAFVWLNKAAQEHAVGFSFAQVDPHLDNLRGDPRYAKLLRGAGFTN